MPSKKCQRKMNAPKAVVAAFCLALATMSFTACSGQPSSGGDSSAPSAVAAVDTSSWKTYGDAMAAQTDAMASSWNDDYYVSVFRVGESIVRVVAKMDPEGKAAIDAVDWSTDNISEQMDAAAGTLELVSAEDITSQMISAQDLAALEGKTGQELVDDGWEFESYFMYGGPQTGATFSKGYLAYSITFDVSISEDDCEDEGASIMDAKVVEASFTGASNAATDLAAIN